MSAVAFCVDIGGSFMKFGLAPRNGEAVRQVDQVPTPAHSWADFVAALADLCARHGAGQPADAPLAISMAGIVDPDSGILTAASNLGGLVGHRLAAELTVALGRPVRVANDADCFALAEATVGAGRGHRVVFGIILGTGIGGGLVVGGRLISGAAGITGEWGHGAIVKTMAGSPPVAIPRLECGCGGVGCIETFGSARGLERLHHHLTGQGLDSRSIVDGWQAGEALSRRTISIFLELVSEPLALLVNAIGPHRVPVGGGLGSSAPLVAALDQAVRALILRQTEEPLLVPAELGANAGLIGAAVLALQP
ncbi:ROK family protein [Niveispirillum sp. SYP-B3756]|nr:ROK family protein [Niveispirillum sp. SYP-B3756]